MRERIFITWCQETELYPRLIRNRLHRPGMRKVIRLSEVLVFAYCKWDNQRRKNFHPAARHYL